MGDIYTRTRLILGDENIKRLQQATVAVFGIGGVGSFAAEALARAGVGHLVLIDSDKVDITNCNRQIHALTSTIGVAKADAMEERLKLVNPTIEITKIKEFYLPENRAVFFPLQYDFIVDAIDTITSKIDLARYADEVGLRLISSMGTGNKLHPERLELADIYETSVCPIARIMRKKLKLAGVKKLKVVYSKEEPLKVPELDGERVPGSTSFVPSTAGLIAAGYVVRELCGIA